MSEKQRCPFGQIRSPMRDHHTVTYAFKAYDDARGFQDFVKEAWNTRTSPPVEAMTHSPDGASAGELDLDELEKVARAAVDYFDRIKARGVMVSLDATPDDFLETFDPPTVLQMIAALRAHSPSPGLGGSSSAERARTGTLPLLTSTPCQSENEVEAVEPAPETVWRACRIINGGCENCPSSYLIDDEEFRRSCYQHAVETINVVETGNPWRKAEVVSKHWVALSSEAPSPKSEETSPHDPRRHAADCSYHCDQYPWECDCGVLSSGEPTPADAPSGVISTLPPDALIPPGFVVAPREVVERVGELESALRYAVGLLPGLAGAYDKPDNAVYSVMATKGEILKARATLPPPGGGNGSSSTHPAARIASDHAATAPHSQSEGDEA